MFIIMFSPKSSFFCLVGVLCTFWCAGYSHMKSCVETNKEALLKLKDGFIDDSGILSTWKNEVNCCQWSGITCSNLTGHVVKLDLESSGFSNELRGNIDSSLCDLHQLTYLSLVGNNFGGSKIPECIGSLGHLRQLVASENSIGGTIPGGLQNLSNLQTLDLSFNPLFVNDLGWISHLPSLRYLGMSGVNLSQVIDWPSSLSKAPHVSEIYLDDCELMSHVSHKSSIHTNFSTSLTSLSLSSNYLDSSILPWLSNVSRVLTYLQLQGNALGNIFPNALNINSLIFLDLGSNSLHLSPKAFSNMNSLEFLYLYRTSLQHIPSDAFTNTTSLEYLDLSYNHLENSMLQSIANLCQLKVLDLSHNSFSGQLSDWIPQLGCVQYSIQSLNLAKNPFSDGPFPDFSKFSKVEALDLSYNNITGPLPEFGGLVSLKYLYLSNNRLNSVINETHLSTLSNLRDLDVSMNLISFNFSSNWVPPFQLQFFLASSCNFGPHFPRWLKYQRELIMLDISYASISDSIPQWLWLLTSLQHLDLSHNRLYGELPKSFLKFDTYVWDLSFNNLSGPLPCFPPSAIGLFLSNNMFSGTISFICATSQAILSYLDMSNNFLSGRLPDCWGQLPSLMVLRMENNNFSGAVPNSIGTLNDLQSIHLNNNSLFGNLPSLMNSSELLFLDFGQNNLNGKLPSWIGQHLINLIGLRLQANKFQGNIPTNFCNLPLLQILDLSQNNITGRIPHYFGNLSAMSNMTSKRQAISYNVYALYNGSSIMDTAILSWKGKYVEYSKTLGLVKIIDFSCNHLTGEIPSSITTLVALASLNLSSNNLIGSIPNNMGQMKRFESLDLSRNSLSGEIPTSLSSLSFLSVLNLSFNNLLGKIPTGTQLQSFNASSYTGNWGLCGLPLIEVCPNPNPSNNSDVNDANDNLISLGFYVSMAFGFVVGFWGVCGTLVLKNSWRHCFFRFFEDMNDWIYVHFNVLKAKINRGFQD